MIQEFKEEYRWLSNFLPCKISLRGRIFYSVEHAYMSEKNNSDSWKDLCASHIPAGEIKKLSKEIKLRPDWEEVKLLVMEHCLRQKFNQAPYSDKLKGTGDIHIQEGNYWNDTFWGVCLRTNEGLNHLGKLIMKIREEIR